MANEVFTAAQIAAALHRSKRSVLESLNGTPPTGTKIVQGNQAKSWSKNALSQSILAALEEIASRRRTTVDELLASPSPFWRPRYPLSELSQESIESASLLKRALAPALARLDDHSLPSADLERFGVEDYRRAFGHSISTRHWRRLFRRTLNRDGGAENWGRLEIYLDESPARRPELRKRAQFASSALRLLQELISSFENPAGPTELEKDCVWIYAFEHYEQETEGSGKPKATKRATLKFLYANAAFLGKSPKGIKLQFDRKLKRWIGGGRLPAAIADARRRNPGRPAPKLTDEEEHALLAKSLRSGGGLAQAWRESCDKGFLNPRISQHYTATPASKSYVPTGIRKLVANKLKILRDHHHGPRAAKLNGAYINRDPSTFNAGDWFQADDVTLPNYYYTESEEGFALIRGQFLAMCDVRTTFILGYVLIPQRNYTAHHIRNLTTIVADTPVLMADGSEKPIESIQVGETVLAWNEQTKETFPTTVVSALHHEEKMQTLFHIELEDGRKFTVNNDHPMYVVEDSDFIFTDELAARFAKGEPITFQDNNNQPIKIASVRMRRETCKVYNLHVEGQGKKGYTYYASGILVHNFGGGNRLK